MIAHDIWPVTTTINTSGRLCIAECDVTQLANTHGTPLYLFDANTIRMACQAYQSAFANHYPGSTALHYAGKALLNTAVAQLVHREGFGLDVVSGGELFVALQAGVPPAQIHLHGNAKPRAELEYALASDVGRIMVDNLDELQLLATLTTGRARPQSIALRIAPGVAVDTHAHITTGHAGSKFGLAPAALHTAAQIVRAAPGLQLTGLHVHLGSQLFETAPYAQAIEILLDCAASLRDTHGITVTEISPGGGIGAPYTVNQASPVLDAFASAIAHALVAGCAARGLTLPRLLLEPGRSIVTRAGVAIYTVTGRKWDGDRLLYAHVDGGMGDNIRPALYGASYTALLANRADESPGTPVDIAGRYCESSDILLHAAPLPPPLPGDMLAIACAGAYTLSMGNNYNLVPRPTVLLLESGMAQMIQRRETYADLVARDLPLMSGTD